MKAQAEVVETAEKEVIEGQVETEVVEEDEAAEPGEAKEEGSEDEFVVSIGEESPPREEKEAAPEWVKDLRIVWSDRTWGFLGEVL